jgi:hypothetical protein
MMIKYICARVANMFKRPEEEVLREIWESGQAKAIERLLDPLGGVNVLVFFNQVTDEFSGVKTPNEPRAFLANPAHDMLDGPCAFVYKTTKKKITPSNIAAETFCGCIDMPANASPSALLGELVRMYVYSLLLLLFH